MQVNRLFQYNTLGALMAGLYGGSLTFGGHVMDYVISEGMVEVGPVDQLDQRFPVQDRQYLFAKFNAKEVREDIDKAE